MTSRPNRSPPPGDRPAGRPVAAERSTPASVGHRSPSIAPVTGRRSRGHRSPVTGSPVAAAVAGTGRPVTIAATTTGRPVDRSRHPMMIDLILYRHPPCSAVSSPRAAAGFLRCAASHSPVASLRDKIRERAYGRVSPPAQIPEASPGSSSRSPASERRSLSSVWLLWRASAGSVSVSASRLRVRDHRFDSSRGKQGVHRSIGSFGERGGCLCWTSQTTFSTA